MPVDTSIYQNYLKPPKSMAEFDQENMLSQENSLKLKTAQQGYDDSNSLREATKSFGADSTANMQALQQRGLYKPSQDYLKSILDAQKTKSETAQHTATAQKTGMETLNLRIGQYKDQLGPINDSQAGAQWVATMYADPTMADLVKQSGRSLEQATAV